MDKNGRNAQYSEVPWFRRPIARLGTAIHGTGQKHESIKTRVLFVDDEASILSMLRWMMKRLEPDFEAVFAESGREALAQMEQGSFDILISDMRMPGMNGVELLNQTMRRSPRTVRVILSGYADEDLAMRCVASTHQWLAKPCSTLVLMDLLNRIRSLQGWLRQRELQSVSAGMTHLPSLPAIYLKISEVLASPHCSTQQVGDLISEDPPLAAKLLQLANSAAFGFHGSVTSPSEAVQMLGGQRVRSLALVHHLFSTFEKGMSARLPLEDIWNHSMRAAFLARQIALAERQQDQFVEQAFSAGLLHDIGPLALAASLGDKYAALWRRAASLTRALHVIEREEVEATHAEAGPYLLGPAPAAGRGRRLASPTESQSHPLLRPAHCRAWDQLPGQRDPWRSNRGLGETFPNRSTPTIPALTTSFSNSVATSTPTHSLKSEGLKSDGENFFMLPIHRPDILRRHVRLEQMRRTQDVAPPPAQDLAVTPRFGCDLRRGRERQ